MSRRNSSTRRRTYGRRLHEMRERRPGRADGLDWVGELDEDERRAGHSDGRLGEGHRLGDARGGLA